MRRFSEKGNVLLFAIIAMTFMSVLGAGAYYLTSTSAFSTIGANDQNRAAQLARAGINYALMMNLSNTAGRDFTLANGDTFHLVISGDTISSTGIIKQGTLYEAKETVSVTETGFSSQSDISTAKDIQSFTTPSQSQSGFITTDTSAAQISLGKIGMGSTFGALWYQGSAVPGNCTGGRCDFGTGFRAFFVFQFGAGSTGDGFTFAFFNGTENDVHAVGGDSGRGELMGYAGDSRTTSAGTYFLDGRGGRGIQPPKMAIEFDVYANYGSTDVCASGSRRDGIESPNPRNHVAYVFWGDNTNSSCTSTVGMNTYDDNRHNAGSGDGPDMPRNSMRPSDGADTSYFNALTLGYAYNWLLSNPPSNVYAFRVEVTRSTTVNAGGNYDYTIKSWVKQCPTNDITCPTYDETSDYANTKTDYTTDTATLTRTISLNPTLHGKFSTFFYGWTTATGGATQNILISRHKINFRN
jgi:hypothetical protein